MNVGASVERVNLNAESANSGDDPQYEEKLFF